MASVVWNVAPDVPDLKILPVAIAYDLVLEDRTLARQGVKRSQRPFSRELAEMVGSAVGYQTRSFTTFGAPIAIDGYDPKSRRDVLELAHVIRGHISRLHKVVPTALVAAAMRPSSPPAELRARVAGLVERLRERGANLDATDPKTIVTQGTALLIDRDALALDDGKYRVRDRTLLRYYARSIDHILEPSRQPGTPVA